MEKIRRKAYLLGEKGVESMSLLDDDTIQLGTLHPKKREDVSPASRMPRDQTIECDIQPSDTLHSLALKYNIPLAELKRVNNILQESEFFALKRIKIPVKAASLLTDILPGVHAEEKGKAKDNNGWYVVDHHKDSPVAFSSNVSSRLSSGCSSPCSEQEVVAAAGGSPLIAESRDRKKVKKFLKDMDRDLARIKEKQSDLVASSRDLLPGPGNSSTAGLKVMKPVTAISSSKSVQQHASPDSGCTSGSLCCWCFLVSCVVVALFLILTVLVSIDHHASLFVEERNQSHAPSTEDS